MWLAEHRIPIYEPSTFRDTTGRGSAHAVVVVRRQQIELTD